MALSRFGACAPISEWFAPRRGGRYRETVRRLAPFLVLLAMLIAPFGRAQAQPVEHHEPAMAMAGHCDPASPAEPGPAHPGSIDCMIACAGVPAFEASLAQPPLPPVAAMTAAPVAALHGIPPQFDPPPPRILS